MLIKASRIYTIRLYIYMGGLKQKCDSLKCTIAGFCAIWTRGWSFMRGLQVCNHTMLRCEQRPTNRPKPAAMWTLNKRNGEKTVQIISLNCLACERLRSQSILGPAPSNLNIEMFPPIKRFSYEFVLCLISLASEKKTLCAVYVLHSACRHCMCCVLCLYTHIICYGKIV